MIPEPESRGGSLRERLAEWMRTRLQALPHDPLPSRRDLARLHGVSEWTVSQALGILQSEGIIEKVKGRPPRAKTAMEPDPGIRMPAHPVGRGQALLEKLRKGIAAGRWPAGRPMPKLAYLARHEGLSYKTVHAAYRSLLDEGLVHRHGRAYVVGRKLQLSAVSPPVILLVCGHYRHWLNILQDERVTKFASVLGTEAERAGVQLFSIVCEPTSTQPPHAVVVAKDSVAQLVRTFDSRYLGALVLSDREEFHDFEDWLQVLNGLGKVVWFDRYGRNRPLSVRGGLLHCRFDPRSAIAMCAEELASQGHHLIAYPLMDHSPWRRERLEALRHEGRRFDPPLEFIVNEIMTGRQVSPELLETWQTAMRGCWSEKTGGSRSSIRELHAKMPLTTGALAPCLSDRRITAVVSSQAVDTELHYHWLRLGGFALPHDLSLVGFDDYPRLQVLPVTRLDFGFGGLGYAAFHYLLGDTPDRLYRSGEVRTSANWVHRGSLGPPRGGPLLASL